MAEMQASSNKKYRLKKVCGYCFLENAYTRKTKRLPFLSGNVKISLEDNLIFADDNVYEIKETINGDISIEKIDDLALSSEQEVDRISENFKKTGSDKIEDFVQSSEQEVDRISDNFKETTSDKIEDFVYSSAEEVDSISESIVETGSDEYKDFANSSVLEVDEISRSNNVPYPHMKDRGPLQMAQREAVVTFQVLLIASKLAKSCELRGKMELRINEDGCSFYNTKSKTVTYTFTNSWIRFFGTCGATKFGFEVGRGCPAGEGQILITTDDSSNLRSTLKRIWGINDKR